MLHLFPRPLPAPRLEEHYGLAQRPFASTLDQHFVFRSATYAAALDDVRHALDRRDGLVVVTGETGTGKTMFCRTLVDELGAAAPVSLVLDPCVTAEDLLRHALADFGVCVSRGPGPCGPGAGQPSRHQLMRALQRCLATLVPDGACAVIIVDEAQHLDPTVLDQLCLLLNLETNESKLLQVVLVGHTSLIDMLDRPACAQLRQRIARHSTLAPLTAGEVRDYVRHRLTTAQRLALAADLDALRTGEAAVEMVPCTLAFTPAALRAVARHSRGVPRIVNRLCDQALEMGYVRRTQTIGRPIVRRAASRLAGPARAVARGRVLARAAAVVAGLAVGGIGAAAGAWQAGAAQGRPALPAPPPVFAAAAVSNARPDDLGRVEVFDRVDIWNGALTNEPQDAAAAAEPRLLGVALVRSGDSVSVAIEMSAEPRRAVLRPLSDRMFEVELGPVAGPVRSEAFAPASEAPLVSQLSIREQRMPNDDRFLRARIVLRAPGRGDVRVAGRVVYVDLEPVGGSR
ncbi:MAG: AAA family ATPase [Acidobacteria bacterium]|nr:AAA family ATPase [Acidobacteriota bacterium]